MIAKAVETGTCLEINSQPDRLDLRDVHARAAGEAGVPVAVSSDGHSVDAPSASWSSASCRRGAAG